MNNVPLISICVPVYNTARYIEKCVRSLFAQTYPNLEFVFVDDASSDDSMHIVQTVALEYPDIKDRIRYLHNSSNQGSAYTRGKAILEAKGEYVFCVDSDDYIEKTATQILYDAAEQNKFDIISGLYVHEYSNHTSCVDGMSLEEYNFNDVLSGKTHNGTVPHLIRRELLLKWNCLPPKGLDYAEDRYLLTCLRYHVRTQTIVPEVIYHYVEHSESLSSSKGEKHFRCLILFYQSIENYLRQYNDYETYATTIQQQKVIDKAHLMLHCHDMNVRKQYADLFREEENQYHFSALHRSAKIVAWLVHHHYWTALRVYQCYINLREKLSK